MLDNSVLKFCEHKKFNNQHNSYTSNTYTGQHHTTNTNPIMHQIHTQDNITSNT